MRTWPAGGSSSSMRRAAVRGVGGIAVSLLFDNGFRTLCPSFFRPVRRKAVGFGGDAQRAPGRPRESSCSPVWGDEVAPHRRTKGDRRRAWSPDTLWVHLPAEDDRVTCVNHISRKEIA